MRVKTAEVLVKSLNLCASLSPSRDRVITVPTLQGS